MEMELDSKNQVMNKKNTMGQQMWTPEYEQEMLMQQQIIEQDELEEIQDN